MQLDIDKEFKRCTEKRWNRGLVLDNWCKYNFLEKYKKELRKMGLGANQQYRQNKGGGVIVGDGLSIVSGN